MPSKKRSRGKSFRKKPSQSEGQELGETLSGSAEQELVFQKTNECKISVAMSVKNDSRERRQKETPDIQNLLFEATTAHTAATSSNTQTCAILGAQAADLQGRVAKLASLELQVAEMSHRLGRLESLYQQSAFNPPPPPPSYVIHFPGTYQAGHFDGMTLENTSNIMEEGKYRDAEEGKGKPPF
ncbi:uncharacterized protein N7482_000683 [Penicillium canariense]|uniref:Uncharacterized protein n=1 Tax=Penicillium canariense TaxID=189055 RepID=A0A9W9IIB6_9EURO|nr:uncharacterized protein N7482_000683 [Penicillium canariense]KAJ5174806.1 hypothetical protein N7482_000683 [Penicillium canariense]